MNTLREKLKTQKIAGTLVCLSDPCLCEIMGNIGYDCVWIDMEHTYVSYKEVLCHLNAARSANISSVIRLPQNDLTATKKILEMGADGIIFPMVRSEEEFDELMKMTLYPPLGSRGFGPMRAIGYNAANAGDYVTRDCFDLCRFVQIEHVDMIDSLEKIAQSPYVDGFIFGPNDLSGSLGELLKILCCPETRQPLREAEAELVERLNADIQAQKVNNVGNLPVTEIAEGFLITADSTRAYPVRSGIPVLLADEGIIL